MVLIVSKATKNVFTEQELEMGKSYITKNCEGDNYLGK